MKINNLKASGNGRTILQGINLQVAESEVHVVIGPNGSGKSSLANVIIGHPDYQITEGTIEYGGKDLATMPPEERARQGIFLAFQHPVAIPGVPVSQFIRLSLEACGKASSSHTDYLKALRSQLAAIGLPASTAARAMHEGMSGGEQKRLELLQLRMHQPRLAILDEIDSGLDIDGLRIVGDTVNQLRQKTAFIIITHNPRFLSYIEPDYVHILKDGVIARSGKEDLMREVEENGYGAS